MNGIKTKLFLASFALAGWIAPEPCSAVHEFANCDTQACNSACDANACDALPNGLACSDDRVNPYTHDILPGMFGDGGLIVPRVFGRTASGTQIVAQNHLYKIAENNSAIPQNRIGFNFNAMQDVFGGQDNGAVAQDLYEYRLFLEKTFLDGRISFDFMVPFYTTSKREYDSAVDLAVNGPQTDGTFGDLAFGMKALLHQTHDHALSLGLRVEVPTDDQIVSPPGANLFYPTIEDEVWHFTPYLASLWNPNDRLFLQSFLSYRLGTGSVDNGTNLFREQDYLMADVSLGYWMYRNRCSSGLTGLASQFELHYTGATTNEVNSSGNLTVTDLFYGNSDRLNLTAGLTAVFGDRLTGGVAVSVPLRDTPYDDTTATIDTDRAYDWAVLTQLTYHFGRR